MGYSAKVRINKYYKKADRRAAISIQILINRQKWNVPLHITWDPERFDEKENYCIGRNDQEAEDNNLIIRNAMAKANEIFTYFRLINKPISLERFKTEYRNEFSRTNFIAYFRGKLKYRYENNEIEKQTHKNHKNTFNKIDSFFKGELLFTDITSKTLRDFDNWMRKKGYKQNTRWFHIRDFKAYLRLARKDNIYFEEDFEQFKINPVEAHVDPLTEEEFITLYKYFKSSEITFKEKRALAPFLFSCINGGLRISDLKRIKHDDIKDGFLIIVPYKTRRTGKKIHIPILDISYEFIETESGLLFECYAEQFANRLLKDIAKKAGIKKNLHHHLARDTFGTLFIAKKGNPAVLKEIMGHSKYKITLKYVHVNDRMKKDEMQLMNNVIKTPIQIGDPA